MATLLLAAPLCLIRQKSVSFLDLKNGTEHGKSFADGGARPQKVSGEGQRRTTPPPVHGFSHAMRGGLGRAGRLNASFQIESSEIGKEMFLPFLNFTDATCLEPFLSSSFAVGRGDFKKSASFSLSS